MPDSGFLFISWGTGYRLLRLEMLEIPDFLGFLRCIKAWIGAMGGITQNSVSRFLFICGVHVIGPWMLERDEFCVFLAKYLSLTGSQDE